MPHAEWGILISIAQIKLLATRLPLLNTSQAPSEGENLPLQQEAKEAGFILFKKGWGFVVPAAVIGEANKWVVHG